MKKLTGKALHLTAGMIAVQDRNEQKSMFVAIGMESLLPVLNQLKKVLDPIGKLGMKYQLLALRNKSGLGKGVYCHFILEITK